MRVGTLIVAASLLLLQALGACKAVAAAFDCTTNSPPDQASATPTIKPDPRWSVYFAETLVQLKRTQPKVILLGDSIFQRWPEDLLQESFPGQSPVNFSASGDRTENLLWRIEHARELLPKDALYVVLIGTNNLWAAGDVGQTIDGVRAVLDRIHAIAPPARILLLGLLPKAFPVTDPIRPLIRSVNERLGACSKRDSVTYADVGDLFLLPNGDFDPMLSQDALHPTAMGYQKLGRWLSLFVRNLQSAAPP
jgi:beta-glucosidase